MRIPKIIVGILVLFVLAMTINALIVDSKTKPAGGAAGGRLIDVDGQQMFVREDGRRNAPPVVLIHGWTASTNWWDRMTPLLAKRYRVIRVDLLGHGRSSKPKGGYSMEEQADRVNGALERLNVDRALLAGHSTGGEVAIALAARHPRTTRKLIVMDTEPDEDYLTIDTTAKLSTTPLVGQTLWVTAPEGELKKGIQQAFLNDSVPVPQMFVDDLKGMTYNSYDATQEKSASYVADGYQERDVKSIRKPIMIVFGAGDRLMSTPKSLALFQQWLPRAEFVTIPDAGHSPLWEQPQRTSAAFVEFDRR